MRDFRTLALKVVIHTTLAVTVATGLTMAVTDPSQADHEPKSTLDAFSGIGLDAREEGGPLVRKYPISHYRLDYNIDNGGTFDFDQDIEAGKHAAAGAIWNVTKFLTSGAISIFVWAFSFDLLENGVGGAGAAARTLYTEVIGRELLVIGIMLMGAWAMWKGLVQRKFTETAQSLGLSVVFAVLALFFVFRPAETVSQANVFTNSLSNTILSVATIGPEPPGGIGPRQPGTPLSTKGELSDALFKAFVYDPWVALNFGGMRHCVDNDAEPVPLTTRGGDIRCIDHRTAYAPYWLRYEPGSDARKVEYNAINDGEVPDETDDPAPLPGQFADREIGDADEPAVDIQQEGAGDDRIGLAALVFLGNLGLVVLLGALSLGIVLAQVIALALIICAAVMLLVGIFPGKGHDLFMSWLRRLVEVLLRKAVYSLIVAIILAMLLAMSVATADIPWGISYVLQAAFLWGVFLMRNKISDALKASPAGQKVGERISAISKRTGINAAAVGGGALGTSWSLLRATRSSDGKGEGDRTSQAAGGRASKDQQSAAGTSDDGSRSSSPSDLAASADSRISRNGHTATAGERSSQGGRDRLHGDSPVSAETDGPARPRTPSPVQDGGSSVLFDQDRPGDPTDVDRADQHWDRTGKEPTELPTSADAAESHTSENGGGQDAQRQDRHNPATPSDLSADAQRRIEARPDQTTPPYIVQPDRPRRPWRWLGRRDKSFLGSSDHDPVD